MEGIHQGEFRGRARDLRLTAALTRRLVSHLCRDLLQVSSVWLMLITPRHATSGAVPFDRGRGGNVIRDQIRFLLAPLMNPPTELKKKKCNNDWEKKWIDSRPQTVF